MHFTSNYYDARKVKITIKTIDIQTSNTNVTTILINEYIHLIHHE